MSLYPYWCDIDNIGDRHLNEYLLQRLFPFIGNEPYKGILYGIGSILHSRPKCFSDLPEVVFSSGYQYKKPRKLHPNSRVYCVRGLYTCRKFRLPDDRAVADGGILLPLYLPISPTGQQEHCTVMKWNYAGEPRDDLVTSRCSDGLVKWVQNLLTFKKVTCDALHAAIIADAYGVPWKPLRWEPKWADHFEMMGIDTRPRDFVLSDRNVLKQKQGILLERKDALLKDFGLT